MTAIQGIIHSDENPCDNLSAILENVNSRALPAVQTCITQRSSNGCQVTMHFANTQESDIECSVANM